MEAQKLLSCLLAKEKDPLRAWRRILDQDSSNRVNWFEKSRPDNFTRITEAGKNSLWQT